MATKKVYWNTIAQIGGKISTALLSIVLIKILTNYLPIEGYGLYSKVYNYLSIFAVLADLGLYAITVREIAKHRDDTEHVRDIQGNMMTIRTALWVWIIFLSTGIAMFLPGYSSPLAIGAIIITWVFTLFWLVNSAVLSFLQGFLQTQYSFVSTTVGKVVNVATIALIVFALFPASALQANPDLYNIAFLSVMGAWLLGNVVMTIMIWRHANTIVPVGFRFRWSIARTLLISSIPYWLALFFNTIYFKQDVALLSFMVPAKEADTVVGLYSVSMKIVEVGMMFGTLFLNSMLPLFAEAIKQKDDEGLKQLSIKAYKALFLFWLGIAVYLSVNAHDMILLLSKKEYLSTLIQTKWWSYGAEDAFVVAMPVFLVYFLSSIFTYLLVSANEQRRLLKVNIIMVVFNAIGNILLIPYLSFYGSALMTLISEILLLIATWIVASRVVKFRPPFAFMWVSTFCAVLGGFLNWWMTNLSFLQWFHPAIRMSCSGIVFAIVFLGGVFTIYGKETLREIFKKGKTSAPVEIGESFE